jgi:uncharacterized protein
VADEPKGAPVPQGPAGPLLVYPTDYPFKAIGLDAEDLAEHVRRTILAAAPGVEIGSVETRKSSGGKYLSVTVKVRLGSEDERRAIYAALAADARIVQYL